MELASKYDSQKSENQWYDYWLKHKYFHSTPDDREPYTIVIPPPNVTGVLHMGHMLNNTIQDVLIRRARLQGKNACWVPGTDHASIATEAKVVAKLKEKGINKADLTREEFLKHAWDWTDEYGGVILDQLKKLGCSCDWDRTSFTMDDHMSASVIKVFVDLYNKGKIYRGYRMVNWDPEAQTTLSDEEVIHEEKQGNLYYINYKIEGSEDTLTIATTRPETIFGDTAICINPNDERFTHLKGKKAIVPIVNRVIPIIEDEYVDLEFGTGCLKVTPAHDVNDKSLGDKHNLEVVDIFNADATLNSFGLHYEGKDRFVVRKEITKELEEKGFLVKTEQHLNKVGTSERTKAVIEPRLSDQWFLKMEELAKPAIEAVLGDNAEVKLFPKKFENTYRHWMENIRDWNISRQLWWGQQIPAYYFGDGKDDFVVAENKEDALKLAQEKSGNTALTAKDLRQDEDALDTWFSSWLWPMSVFNGVLEPENEEIKYYYPTNDLVTGPDILFFWVARMIVAGYEYKDQKPFENVYLTGLVRDKQRRKMSKSLGNSPDALKLIEEYGADGVRVGLLLSSAAGNDLMFDEALCQQGKNFANKIWNGFRLIKGWEVADIAQPEASKIGLEWYNAKFNKTLLEIEDHFSKYRISDALMAIYKLVWDDYSSWLLEIVKPAYQQPIDRTTYNALITVFEQNLKLLHPFMPFLTEEVWQHIEDRKPEQALVVAQWPEQQKVDEAVIANFDFAAEVVSGVRTIRKEKNIPMKEALELSVLNAENVSKEWDVVIAKLTNVSSISYTDAAVDGALSFRVKSNEYFIPMVGAIDIEAEIKKIEEELKYTKGFLISVQKKLSNERFVNNAPEKVIEIERKKQADAEAKIETLEKSLKGLQ
ncbi:valine--tRNA ligase [Cellulophaga lytica]|uniref:Valine--tRNA ligase n=1 Tax=Cellulophaga lytica (strain ATCC 23178 / DSM 7489 / JCM 8516 / NBRC 14961 / NCIMB 1423 / VKM B-1433 / Cy l20) TaxID=867900 RepID=F0RAM1_CELLC|nr:valine--tRNA ligase [Cellulophaga lytica]ADY28414.1 Valyl-tRNA synthetase [Cellulophaga lytica DSM 7489]WQG77408.1 valine--tRNA ligase [Cellulophaga lytica]